MNVNECSLKKRTAKRYFSKRYYFFPQFGNDFAAFNKKKDVNGLC